MAENSEIAKKQILKDLTAAKAKTKTLHKREQE